MLNKTIPVLLLLIVVLAPLRGQDNTVREVKYDPVSGFMSDFYQDLKKIQRLPSEIDNQDLINFTAFSAILYYSYKVADVPVSEDLRNHKKYTGFNVVKPLYEVGKIFDDPSPSIFIIGIPLFMGGAGYLRNDIKMMRTAGMVVRSFLYSAVIMGTVIKISIGRARPYMEKGNSYFKPFSFSSDYFSFPSGHTISVFSIVSVITKQYKSWWIKVPAYSFAIGVGLQRIIDKKHWPSDVVMGAVIGYFVGDWVVNSANNTLYNNVRVYPLLGYNFTGINLRYQF